MHIKGDNFVSASVAYPISGKVRVSAVGLLGVNLSNAKDRDALAGWSLCIGVGGGAVGAAGGQFCASFSTKDLENRIDKETTTFAKSTAILTGTYSFFGGARIGQGTAGGWSFVKTTVNILP